MLYCCCCCTAAAVLLLPYLRCTALPPGNEPHDVGSGIGHVHNTSLFDHPQKGVLYAPWTYSPQPLWSVGQLGLSGALPWAFKYMCSQHNPPLALVYLVRLAIVALRHSWRPAAGGPKQQTQGNKQQQ
jgi:hypothetical protein